MYLMRSCFYKQIDISELTKKKKITPLVPTSGSVYTSTIHPHFNRVDSEIPVNTD